MNPGTALQIAQLGVGVASDLFGGIANKKAQDRAMAFNADQAQIARDWSAKSYQNTVKDMKAAGLNPILMYGSGGAVQSGAVASTTAQKYDFHKTSESLNQMSPQNVQRKLLEQNIKESEARIHLSNEEAKKVSTETAWIPRKNMADIQLGLLEQSTARKYQGTLSAQYNQMQQDLLEQKQLYNIHYKYMPYEEFVKQVTKGLSAVEIYNNIIRGK